MAVYLSPGVFPREIDISALPVNTSAIIPAFVGTAKKGPINTPTLITTSEQFIDTFGEPFAESYMGYAVLSYLTEGNAAWILRIGIECEDGQDSDLDDICIDTSGNKIEGWGRIPVFSGIDYGKIVLRTPSTDEPFAFHSASTSTPEFTDVNESTSDGPTSAVLTLTGTYTGSIDDSFMVLITSDPDASGGTILGSAEYQVIRNSDGTVISSGSLVEVGVSNVSHPFLIGTGDEATGLTGVITVVGNSPIEAGDNFVFEAHPNNRSFKISVEGATDTTHTFTDGVSYTTPASFVTAFNALVTTSVPYIAVWDGTQLYIRTDNAGERIQVVDTEAWALEVGVSKWTYDIPRSFVQGLDVGPYTISTSNNRISFNVIGTERTTIDISLATATDISVDALATIVNAGGIKNGERYFEAIALQVNDDDKRLTIITDSDHQFEQLVLLADYSHTKTLKFSETLGIAYPYTNNYTVFNDTRVELPEPGETTPATPLSCEQDPSSSTCAADTAYFANIVGFLVATSPGTWLNDWTVSLSAMTNAPGEYELTISDNNGVVVERLQNVSFDPNEDRYIANIINPGSSIGGTNGNKFVNWEERPEYLDNDPTADDFEPRQPGAFTGKEFSGMADGIPTDASFSSLIDAAIIGNPSRVTGLYALQDPDRYNISLLCIPGNSSGSVIAAGITFCEGRGDCIYIVDPPFGLRPAQVVDWHNGLLFSDLASSLNSSYAALYYSWLKVYDQFAATEIYVPPCGHIASVFARTARETETWFAPAGLNRGKLLSALDVEYNPTQGERDLLYGFNNAVNPIANFYQDGITVWGQRTLQRNDTALDRVNVRMLLIAIKKTLTAALRQFVFEPNDRFLWAQVKSVVGSFLGDIASRRGLTAYKVIVDETNNTPERIDRNELWVSVLLKPTRTAEFVQLNLGVLRSDASFSADEVLAAAGVVV